jgi:hypothetical protein
MSAVVLCFVALGIQAQPAGDLWENVISGVDTSGHSLARLVEQQQPYGIVVDYEPDTVQYIAPEFICPRKHQAGTGVQVLIYASKDEIAELTELVQVVGQSGAVVKTKHVRVIEIYDGSPSNMQVKHGSHVLNLTRINRDADGKVYLSAKQWSILFLVSIQDVVLFANSYPDNPLGAKDAFGLPLLWCQADKRTDAKLFNGLWSVPSWEVVAQPVAVRDTALCHGLGNECHFIRYGMCGGGICVEVSSTQLLPGLDMHLEGDHVRVRPHSPAYDPRDPIVEAVLYMLLKE